MPSLVSRCLLLLFFTLLSTSSAHLQHDALLSERQIDCFPQFSLSQPEGTRRCGVTGTYWISSACTCCSYQLIGCRQPNVCAINPAGGNMCCPSTNPNCGIPISAATTRAVNSPAAATSSVNDGSTARTTTSHNAQAATSSLHYGSSATTSIPNNAQAATSSLHYGSSATTSIPTNAQAATTSNGSGQAAKTTGSSATASSASAVAVKLEGKLPWLAMGLIALY